MKISEAQVIHSGEKQSSVSQGEKTKQSVLMRSPMTPAAGEQLEISREAELTYQMSQKSQFNAASTVSAGGAEVGVHSQNELLANVIRNTVAGSEAVSIIRSVGGGESTTLQGEVKIQLDDYVFYAQEQSASMSFRGDIETEDGRTIGFSMHLAMQQSQRYDFNQRINIERRPLTDPLVLNFGSDSVKLSNAVFEFDIDADGDKETLRQLGSGSGFLALDKNADGVINDGHELFGSATGNGFAELAYHDSDQNGWIDENDAVFNQLSVMVLNSRGEQELHSLKELGVGAIYLESEESPIDMMDRKGMLVGAVKRTGMFLMEDGQAKTVQELDLADMKVLAAKTEASAVVIRGDRLPPEAQGNSSGQNSNSGAVYYGMSVEMLTARFAEIRQQQDDFLNSQNDTSEAPEVSFIKKLFEQIELVSQQVRDRDSRVSAQYRAFNSGG